MNAISIIKYKIIILWVISFGAYSLFACWLRGRERERKTSKSEEPVPVCQKSVQTEILPWKMQSYHILCLSKLSTRTAIFHIHIKHILHTQIHEKCVFLRVLFILAKFIIRQFESSKHFIRLNGFFVFVCFCRPRHTFPSSHFRRIH